MIWHIHLKTTQPKTKPQSKKKEKEATRIKINPTHPNQINPKIKF